MMRDNVSNINIEKNQNSQNWSYVVLDLGLQNAIWTADENMLWQFLKPDEVP